MTKVVGYQPGEWSLIAFDDGNQVMVSVGGTSLWIFVCRAPQVDRFLHRWLPSLLLRHPQLAAKRTLLAVAPVRKADGSIARFRAEDLAPLELGRTLLEVVTECLQEYSDVDGRQFSEVAPAEQRHSFNEVKEMLKNGECTSQFDEELRLTALSKRDLQARLAFRRELLRLHPGATPEQLFEASARLGVYNPGLASTYFREILQSLSASGPLFRELEMHLKGPLPSWLCFPEDFWKELESLQPPARDRRLIARMQELGIDLAEVSDKWQ